ncbi:hypothetical protein CEXT_677741 [Caerostris extrusa]|uniref:Uncharacterized protein n=1 Tax=Caerostris extrusa TaxID=172846 RepID=A0AAV4N2P2_CAEEX|nr:hypothetical protein CEXT_677741 [Caerostris extrusa]
MLKKKLERPQSTMELEAETTLPRCWTKEVGFPLRDNCRKRAFVVPGLSSEMDPTLQAIRWLFKSILDLQEKQSDVNFLSTTVILHHFIGFNNARATVATIENLIFECFHILRVHQIHNSPFFVFTLSDYDMFGLIKETPDRKGILIV